MLLGEVPRLRPVDRGVVELPHVVGQVHQVHGRRGHEPRRPVGGDGRPPVVVDAAVAEDLEVLGGVLVLGVDLVKRVVHRHALERLLGHAVDGVRHGQTDRVEDRRGDVHAVVPLVPPGAGLGDPARPVRDEPVARAAVVGGHLLGPLVRGAQGDRPRRREMGVRVRPSELVELREGVGGRGGQPVETREVVGGAEWAALRRGAVVADHVEDQRVLQAAGALEVAHEPAQLVIGVFEEPRIQLHEPGRDLLVVVVQVVPRRQTVGEGAERGVLRDGADLLLSRERALPERVPAARELAAVPVAVVLRDVERGADGAERQVAEPRLVGGDRGHVVDPGHRPVHQVLGEVVALLRGARRVDLLAAVVEDRGEVVGLGAEESVEGVEPLLGGPAVERAGGGGLPRRGLVHLSESAGRVPVAAQDAGDGGGGVGPGAVVAGGPGGLFGDHAHAHAVVVAAGECGGAGG